MADRRPVGRRTLMTLSMVALLAAASSGAAHLSSSDRSAVSASAAPAPAAAPAEASQAPAPAPAAAEPTGDAMPTVETVPVASSGDAADDPAIWRDPVDPSRSIVIGNDKGGALEVYDLTGARLQRITGGFFGNVDTRTGLVTGTGTVDVAVVYRAGIRVYKIDPVTRTLVNITDTTSGSIASPIGGEGLCLYHSAVDGALYAFVNARDGRVIQVLLDDSDDDGKVEGTVVRQWAVGSETEGCVADDDLGTFYISEEDVAIWRYGAEPTASTTARTAVDRVTTAGGHIRADAEGLALVDLPDGGGYLIASSQAASDTANSYLVYERGGDNAFVREFRVVTNPGVADGCGRTDGIAAMAADLGPAFPHGLFVCQDNANTAPGSAGNQDFKLVPLERVVAITDEPPPPPPSSEVSFLGSASSDANALTHRVTVPADVQAGDGLLLLMASNTAAAVTGPAGWQLLDQETTGSATTSVWRKVATATDAGSVVRVSVARYSKADLVVLAYRGTSTTDPVAGYASTTSTGTSHATPVLTLPGAGLVVSYWTHKDSSSALLTAPPGVQVRSNGTQSGSGTVKALVADSPADGALGGLVATAGASSPSSTAWTIALAAQG